MLRNQLSNNNFLFGKSELMQIFSSLSQRGSFIPEKLVVEIGKKLRNLIQYPIFLLMFLVYSIAYNFLIHSVQNVYAIFNFKCEETRIFRLLYFWVN